MAKISAHFKDIFRGTETGKLKGERRSCCCRRQPQRCGCLDLGELNVSEILVPKPFDFSFNHASHHKYVASNLGFVRVTLVWSKVIQLQVLGAV